MNEWFAIGVQWAQSLMLFACGYFLLDGVRTVKRGSRIIKEQQHLLHELMGFIKYQQGIIAALQAGVIGSHNLQPKDFSNLPIELRLRILHALIAVGVEMYHRQSDAAVTQADQ